MENQEYQTKKCSKCQEVKPINMFNKNKAKKDGLHNWCKKCKNENKRKNYLENPDLAKEKVQQWRNKNPDRVALYNKNWRAGDPLKIKKIRRNNYLSHKENEQEKNKIWAINHPNHAKEYQKNKRKDDQNY